MNTIKDVARAAGVSVSTVSRALRGLDRVNPQTRERVRQVAEQLDYVASQAATSLVSGRARMVAVVTPVRGAWASASLIAAVSSELAEHGYLAILIHSADDSGQRRLTDRLMRMRFDGVIAVNVLLSREELDLVDRLRLPLVAVGPEVPGRAAVGINAAETTRTATEYLIGLGHSRIAYIAGARDLLPSPPGTLTGPESFLATLHDHGLRAPAAHLLVDGNGTHTSATSSVRSLLQNRTRPSAIVAASDEIAVGLLRGARQLGVEVPAALSIIGIGDHGLAEILDLTTMRQDVRAQGIWATAVFLQLLADPGTCPESHHLPTQLIVRGTTAEPAKAGRRRNTPTA